MAISFSPNLANIVQDALGLNAYGIGRMRTIEWGKNYLWAIRFTDPKCPKPFDDFFPAQAVDVGLSTLESRQFDQGQTSYKMPKNTNSRNVSITFYDDDKSTLLRWMTEWIEIDILNGGYYMSCLNDSHSIEVERTSGVEELGSIVWPVREIEFMLLNNDLEEVEGTKRFMSIYPDGDINFAGSSGSEANIFSLSFAIVGERQNISNKKDSNSDILKKAKKTATQLLGRFL